MSKLVKKYPLLGSSSNPEKLSATFLGIATYLIPIIIAVASYFGIGLAEADLSQLVQQLGIIIASAVTVFGLLRKLYNKFQNR